MDGQPLNTFGKPLFSGFKVVFDMGFAVQHGSFSFLDKKWRTRQIGIRVSCFSRFSDIGG
ncbi:hypothetical protein DSCW_40900 [Desulfosarcina widdelii]|uniref:Uncharacterized protein n=1 Tax=Desulfosarcina widdelii TaxID=947919 RepID=A0A5K7ZA23_9BACT|nr:hypothetical protein DSCW_40900 [Desulfosarcina widdelii]